MIFSIFRARARLDITRFRRGTGPVPREKSPAGENFFGGPEVFSNRKIAISARFSPSRVIYLIYFRSIFCSIFVLSCCCSVLLTKSIPKGVISVAPLRVL